MQFIGIVHLYPASDLLNFRTYMCKLSFIKVLTNKNFCSPLSKMVEQNKSKIVQPALGENVCTSFFQFSFIVLCNKKVDKNTDAFLFHS